MHGLPVSCPFNFPNGNLKQQLSHIGVFICYQNIDAKNKLNLHIYGILLLNPHKTVVSHLKCDVIIFLIKTRPHVTNIIYGNHGCLVGLFEFCFCSCFFLQLFAPSSYFGQETCAFTNFWQHFLSFN